MASKTQFKQLGVDVAKDWLDIFDGDQVVRIANREAAINSFITQLGVEAAIALESTSDYHELFFEQAFAAGHTVYVVNAFRLSNYRKAVGVRAKTDAEDAQLLWRYLQAEKQNLAPSKPTKKSIKLLNRLIKARAKLAKTKNMLKLSLENISELKNERNSLMKKLDKSMDSILKRIQFHIRKAGYQEDFERCLGIPGIGPINAANLVAIYHRGDFQRADAFIAFMGLDVRVRESGYFRGKRKLTKQGDPETRRLLFNAARSASRTTTWNEYYQSLRERGHTSTATGVILSRKMARLAFALLRDQSQFQPKAA